MFRFLDGRREILFLLNERMDYEVVVDVVIAETGSIASAIWISSEILNPTEFIT
jgi:hypothetical protein